MSTRRSRDSHSGRNQEGDSSDGNKIKTGRSRRSATGTPGDERVVRGKGSARGGPRNQKGDSAADQSVISPVASGGTRDVERTPRRSRGRTRKSVNSDTSTAHDKDLGVSAVEAGSEPLYGLTDSESISKGREPGRRKPSSGRQAEDQKTTRSKAQHLDPECSHLKSNQSSDGKGSLQRDTKNMSHRGKLDMGDDATLSESVASPPVKRRGRQRKSQPQDKNGLSDGLSPTNQIGSSNEKAADSDTPESDGQLGQHSTINRNNSLVKEKLNSKQSPGKINQTPRKSENDSEIDVPQVTTTGRKRRRPRKTETLDKSFEFSSHDAQCSVGKELGSSGEVRLPVKRKRGQPRKTTSDPIEMGLESKQNTSLESETSDEEPDTKKQPRRMNDDGSGRHLGVECSTIRTGVRRTRLGGRFDASSHKRIPQELKDVKGKKKQPKEKDTVDDKEMRTCAQCKKEFPTRRDMRNHLLRDHHLIWMPNNPEGVFNLAKVFRTLGKLPCLKCGKETRFPQYYKFHANWCGREDEMTECELCRHTVKSMYMTQHIRQAHKSKKSKVNVEQDVKDVVEEEVTITSTGRVRRKAATKAIDHIKNLDQTELFQTDADNIHKYSIAPRVIPKDIMDKFREQLKTDGKATCCFEGCSATTSSGIWASRHYHRCPRAPPDVASDSFQCARCSAIFKSKSDIETHVKKHRWKEQHHAADTDDSADSYVSDSDTSSSSDTGSDSDPPLHDTPTQATGNNTTGSTDVTVKKKPSKPKSGDLTGYPTKQLARLTPSTLANQVFPSGLQWTLAWLQSLRLTGICPEWRPKAPDWTLVDNVAPYLPVSELSPSFCIKQKKKIKVPTMKLPLFDAVLHGGATFNVGGPIWAAAWCPVPVTETGRQYLAVYCHKHPDDTHIVEQCLDTNKALLQIWDCGSLQKGSTSEKPQLYLAVAADYGVIWDMSWCLNGAWDSPDMELQDGFIPRLGLLALASADGTVHILSIPQPSCSLTNSRPEGKLPVYTVKSCIDLVPTFSPNEVGSQCLCVDWTCGDEHSLIAAGFADGTVALWDLHSKSPLLYTSSPTEGATLRAYETFIAHPIRTTGIKFCPPNHQFFGTCSHDRTMKLWDMNDLRCPLNKTICSQMTNIVWPIYWSLTYTSGDDCYCFGHNAMQVIDNGYYGLSVRPMTIHNSCIWDVSNSDWVNTVVSASSSGEVAGIWLPDMAYSYLRLKGFIIRRFFVFKTTLEELTDDDPHKGAPQSLQGHAGRKSTSIHHDREAVKEGSSKGDVSTEGGASSASRESSPGNTDNVKSKCINTRTDTGVCNKTATDNTSRTKCTQQNVSTVMEHDKDVHSNNLTETDGRGDNGVAQSASSSGAISGTTEKPNCDDRKTTCVKDTDVCIVYSDKDMNRILDNSQERTSFAKNMPHDQLDKTPLLAIHKVCWNPNRGCHLWLAAGGHAGLIRLRHITGLHSKKT